MKVAPSHIASIGTDFSMSLYHRKSIGFPIEDTVCRLPPEHVNHSFFTMCQIQRNFTHKSSILLVIKPAGHSSYMFNNAKQVFLFLLSIKFAVPAYPPTIELCSGGRAQIYLTPCSPRRPNPTWCLYKKAFPADEPANEPADDQQRKLLMVYMIPPYRCLHRCVF